MRGVRIELGEIEAVLAEHPAVEQAVVVAREDRPGDRRLVAYVVAQDEPLEAIRESLRRRLPEPMVPSWIIPLAALPRTSSGKVDRRALPPPELPSQAEGFAAPRTPLEEELARLWAEVLGVERVGVHDDFFAIGGHSLLATRLLARMRDAFALEVPLQELFRTPTVAGVGHRIEEIRTQLCTPTEGRVPEPAIPRADRDRFRATRRLGENRSPN